MNEVQRINVPLYDELSVISIWPMMQSDQEFLKLMPSKLPKGRVPDRAGSGRTDPARLCKGLQASRYIDPLPIKILSLTHHITHVDANTEFHLLGLSIDRVIAVFNVSLELRGT